MMNWYRISQQENFDFYRDPSIQSRKTNEIPSEYKQWVEKTSPSNIQSLWLILEQTHNINEFFVALKTYGGKFEWKRLDFPKEPLAVIITEDGKNSYVIDDFENPELKEAREWISSIGDHNLEKYIPYEDFNKIFWDSVTPGFVLYHATDEENKEKILQHGLKQMNKTRGINNTSTGSAVFTSNNPNDISSYGNIIFEININQMKMDGYMPNVEQEEPISNALRKKQLANLVGIEEYYPEEEYASEGLYESTYIIFGDIPAKYLKIYQE